MMECVFGTIGLLAVAGTTLAACGVALTLAVLPQLREQRRSHERAVFLRLQLLHYLNILPQYLQERDRSLSLEHRDILDEFYCMAQHASLLEMEEWTSVLQVQALLMTARNRPSFTKREARVAQQSIDHAVAVLRAYAADELRQRVWWKKMLPSRNTRPAAVRPSMDPSFTLRDTVG
jgi:hypothetical protein